MASGVRLTEYARCAGCAAKMGPDDLAAALSALAPRADPRLLVGHGTFDDAAVFLLAPGLALVQTVDFFAPIVDDPFDFGRVAAANALSDVYAMGGEPLTALSIAAFPPSLPTTVLAEILRGGESVVHEAGALLVGGHTISDEEVKFGLAVTGRVDPGRLLTNAMACAGDVLLLTKPLGTGILATQAKRGRLGATAQAALVASMTTLNAVASREALGVGARCATDVTGFGLLGHALHIARASNVTLQLDARAVPLLPAVLDSLDDGARTGGADRNGRFVASSISWNDATDRQRAVLLDPQTSGGLLVAVAADRAAEYQVRVPGAVVVGRVLHRGAHPLVVA
jgi:selenide,water dikinase